MSKFLDKTGLDTFWAKIKNTFVKKNSNGYVDKSQIPVKTYRAGSSRAYVRICRCSAPTSSTSPTIDCNIRMGDATVRVIIQGYNTWRANVIGYLNSNSFKLYAHPVVVGEETFYDIIAYHTTYCRAFYSSQFLYDYDKVDFSYWAAPYTEYTPTSEEEIPYIMLSKSTASSGNSPVKVNAYGDLSSITVDSTPTSGNTANLVSSDGIKTALDGKANSSDIPQATTTSPKMDGTASAGSETKWAKGDHVHPTDTSREAAANKKTTLDDTSDTDFPTSKAVATYVGTAIANKVDKMSAWLKTGSGDNKSQWFTMASINSLSAYNDLSGIWDLYLKTRGQGSDGKYVMHAMLELSVYTGRYDGTDGTHEQTSPIVRKARLIVEPGWPVEILLKITGKTGNVTVEIITGNFVAITNGKPCAFYMSERAKLYVNQTRKWTYGQYETIDTGSDTRPVSGDNVTVISLDETNSSGAYVYRKTELYEEAIKSTYIPTGTDSDAPVNGKALSDALASGTAARAVLAEKLVPGQTGIGNAFTPIYVANDGTPTTCDTKLTFIVTYNAGATGVTNTPFSQIINAYNLGRILVLLIKGPNGIAYCGTLSYIDATGAKFFVCLQESSSGSLMKISVNSNDVWSIHNIKVTFSSQGAPNGAIGSSNSPLSAMYAGTFYGNLDGAAARLGNTSAVGGSTRPVYFTANGVPSVTDARFIYAVDASGQSITTQYKVCVGSIGNTANTFYFT